jgi:tellurite resistance protein TerC
MASLVITASASTAATEPAAAGTLWLYLGFLILVLVFLALDLGVFHRESHVVSFREAAVWTGIWFATAMVFNVGVYFIYEHGLFGTGEAVRQLDGSIRAVDGSEAAKLFFIGYVVEKSLSMDNVFVIAMIFSFFAVPTKHQHRVLFWGILGALVMRGAMIAIGAALIAKFTWFVYVFGGFLLLSALKMAVIKGEHVDPNNNPAVRLVRRLVPIAPDYDGPRFFTTWKGKRAATPLLLALVLVEFTDLIFAVDSIPAIFAITADPFLVFTSNVFAILGLRSLYFCLASMIEKFRFLKPALIVVLAFVGVKMLLVHSPYKISTAASLVFILAVLGAGVGVSLLIPAEPGTERRLPGPEGILDPAAGLLGRKRRPRESRADEPR